MNANGVFLVDDDLIFRTAATVLVGKELPTYKAHHFENGLEAYTRLMDLADTPEELPKLMLLDINMPVMNGWELLEELRSAPSQIRNQVQIHILTSSIAPEDMNLSETYEFINGYITKPLTKEDLDKLKAGLP